MTDLEAKVAVLHDLTGGPVTIEHLPQLTTADEWVVSAGRDQARSSARAYAIDRAIDELLDKMRGAPLVGEAKNKADARARALAHSATRKSDHD